MNVNDLKTVLVNRYFANKYGGRHLLRFGDLDPLAEEGGFEDATLGDLKALGIEFDGVGHASDHLDAIIGYARKLIELGYAYMDDTPHDKVSFRCVVV